MLVGVVWVVGFILITLMAASRYLFEDINPDSEITPGDKFGARLFIAMMWWFFLLSPSGRKKLGQLWKGELE